jgi:hypothetical protein
MQNTNDMQRETAAKTQAGVVKVHGEKKFEGRDDTASNPNSDGTVHTEKAVAHERGNVANPSASGPRPTDKANQATPSAGGTANPRKVKYDDQHREAQRERL